MHDKREKMILPDCKTLILAEGIDAKLFLIWAIEAYEIEGIQVIDYGGISKLTKQLKALALLDGYENVETIVIARDAEINAEDALKSVQHSLKANNLPFPSKAFEFSATMPNTAIMLFPGCEGEEIIGSGTLEDLCLRTIEAQIGKEILEKSNDFIESINEILPIIHKHKAKLHTYLSAQERYIGQKIGEASKSGAWNWQSEAMKPFKQILEISITV